jgi:hypothetical protein
LSALAKFEARSTELVDLLDVLSSLDWATKFAAPYVMGAEILEADRAQYQRALQLRSKNRTPAFNGLFVMCITNFELFVKEEVDEAVSRKAVAAQAFSNLDKPFQDNYISGVGKVMAGKSSGTVAGVPFSGFDELVKCFSKSYVEDGALRLMGDVFTLLMGNPTWEKLNKLLGTLGIDEPLGKELGSTASMKSQYANAKWSEVIRNAESAHEDALRRRNSIVHNVIPIALGDDDVRQALSFYGAFAAGLDQVIRKHV